MSTNAWNYPCWHHYDKGPLGGTRGNTGMVWYFVASDAFTTEATMLFSFLHRDGFSFTDALNQGLFSLGQPGKFLEGAAIACYVNWNAGSSPYLQLTSRSFGVATRYSYRFGDENGASWLQTDKWYQCGISISASEITYCINGSVSPTLIETTNAPGALNLGAGAERFCIGTASANGASSWTLVTTGWPSLVVGSAAFDSTALDFNDATVRARIWDSNGDFKNPGENGSLWFGDTYGAYVPDLYLIDGVARFDNGSLQPTWVIGSAGVNPDTVPGGLKKQYE